MKKHQTSSVMTCNRDDVKSRSMALHILEEIFHEKEVSVLLINFFDEKRNRIGRKLIFETGDTTGGG